MKIQAEYNDEDNYYREKRNIKKKNNKTVFLFVTTFAVVFFIFLSLASMMSPKIDVPALQDETQMPDDTIQNNDQYKSRLDPRLKVLEMQEESGYAPQGQSDEDINTKINNQNAEVNTDASTIQQDILYRQNMNALEGKKATTQTTASKKQVAPTYLNENEVEQALQTQAPKVIRKPVPKQYRTETIDLRGKIPPTPSRLTMTKVVVGTYSTPAEARNASSKLMNSDLNVTPFIKEVNGSYSLQVGTFASQQKARQMADQLRTKNIPAQVIEE